MYLLSLIKVNCINSVTTDVYKACIVYSINIDKYSSSGRAESMRTLTLRDLRIPRLSFFVYFIVQLSQLQITFLQHFLFIDTS